MLSEGVINALREFMQRVPLNGREVPVYNQVMLSLAAEENEIRRKREERQKEIEVEASQDAKAK